ncbi:MAG: LysR family transcriptional regulator [Thioclava marina]|uniref:LysR family transcriptional regulator n=1 Tax=Thioclava marina TaxID=1915077 RepID=A0ABX3MR22_9RHOB|nr:MULTISPECIES: LysR family transcriptional regulator [Thioclava]TNE83284.1 MAG: LysR family transcriptional regulator [Paracoccaceae bacterium]MBC7144397.1 LysR family transcriptional regulator [Thioclava marina]OOY13897.1 LysR family transcriptional regulator [Thioclava marina]OOY29604.1 LysR family transcriptional regulator [Thioclava sp. L04-15]TNF16840.1 MAG: LysR family transcriptional regulator [Paracoccaceae bacterium]
MAQTDFNDLMWFLAVTEEGSFTRAAAKLGVVQSTLSHRIKKLETKMGMRLLARTTRSVSTTEAGERLRRTLAPRVSEIEEEIAALMELRDRPAGSVRITLSHHALTQLIWPKLRPVLRDYPDIRLELSVDGGFRDIVEDGFDAGIRLGESVEHDMIALRVGPDWRLVAVATPDYLAARGRPAHPQDLLAHDCINRRLVTAGGLYAWEFEKDGKELRVRVEGRLTLNDEATIVAAALDGVGIAYVPEDMVAEHLESGALELLLDDWSPRFAGYHIYYPSRHQNLPAFKVVVNALRH